MEESYIVDDTHYAQPYSDPGYLGIASVPPVLPFTLSRIGRYQQRTMENAMITSLDIQFSQIVSARAIAAHSNVTAVAEQATQLHPEAAARFQALAVQNFFHLTQIIDDSERRRW